MISSLQKKPRGIEPRDLSQKQGNRRFRSNLTQDEFRNAVTRAKDYIKAGDIIQVVLYKIMMGNRSGPAEKIQIIDYVTRKDVREKVQPDANV